MFCNLKDLTVLINRRKEKKLICSSEWAQAFSWLAPVTRNRSKQDKNSCSKSSFVQTTSMYQDKPGNNRSFHTDSMKSDQKYNEF